MSKACVAQLWKNSLIGIKYLGKVAVLFLGGVGSLRWSSSVPLNLLPLASPHTRGNTALTNS